MQVKIFFCGMIFATTLFGVYAQVNTPHIIETGTTSCQIPIYLCDTICHIRIMDDYKIREAMDSLSISSKFDVHTNSFAIEVMYARLRLLRNISRKYIPRNTKEDIRCILQNLSYLTGIEPQGDADLFGITFISSYTISQYERWYDNNKGRICIDIDSRLLYTPNK